MNASRTIGAACTVVIALASASCGGKDQCITELRHGVDSLQAVVARSYRPGLGEFMSGIQVHHVKLWFAGTSANWKLADFEVHEILESLEDIRTYAADRKETALLDMLDPALSSVTTAISLGDSARFRAAYRSLTGTCNGCHRDTGHGFNVITVPTSPPFSDQAFAPVE